MQLVQISGRIIGNGCIDAVDARDLHAALEVRRDFTSWIKARIDQYGFVENVDYLLTKTGEQLPSGTKWRSEYAASLDMAKELAMVERTPKGREVRRYFIECERRLKEKESAEIVKITRRLERLEVLAKTRPLARPVPAISARERIREKILHAITGSPKGCIHLRSIQRSIRHSNKEKILAVAQQMKMSGEIAIQHQKVSGGVRVYFVA